MKYNPAAPEVKENPVPYYAYLRAHAPVYHLEDHDSPRRTGSRAGSPRADSFGPAGAHRARANWPTP